MTDQNVRLPWTQPGWLAEARAWIHSELERAGLTVNGEIEQPRISPWSTVLRVPTDGGDYYFKATTPVLGHEPELTEALARWRPDCMPQVLATDAKRGWMLMPDAGVTLRSQIQSVADIDHWYRVLPLYAEMQIELASRRDELLALGTLDRRLVSLPAQYEHLLADTGALLIDQPDGLTSEEYARFRSFAPQFVAMCSELAAYGIPETLLHDDFHDANILVHDGRYIFFDWGESCVAHPFFTLVVTLRSVAYRLKLDKDAPELTQMRDAYLEPWTRFGSRADVLAAFDLAQRLGMFNRALTWYRVVSSLEEPFRSENADAVPGWTQEFLNAVSPA